MNLEELKEKLAVSEIELTKHVHERIQDKRRKINYSQVIFLIKNQKELYKFQEQRARNPQEKKFKLWFKLNYLYDMNIYIIINEEKGLNRLMVISAHKVKRRIQQQINKNENKN